MAVICYQYFHFCVMRFYKIRANGHCNIQSLDKLGQTKRAAAAELLTSGQPAPVTPVNAHLSLMFGSGFRSRKVAERESPFHCLHVVTREFLSTRQVYDELNTCATY